jgi:diadenosine tetraphosphatase ApaH/serine/threonine PP2A family protein phosphatase
VKYLIISDIHGNLEAFEATLAAAGRYDRALVLGDLVGYGADPNAVIERVRQLREASIIRGNHDKVAAGLETAKDFNQIARVAIEWTAAALTPANRAWLAGLAAGPVMVDGAVEICHGTPFDEDVYMFDDLDTLHSMRAVRGPLCLFGHTHVPAVFRLPGNHGAASDALEALAPATFTLEKQARYLVNCGAVGQPRDGDPRAAFGIFDTETRIVALLRTDYDISAAQDKILRAGLPPRLAQRLAVGR